jgi:hypothetical protein
MSTTHRLVPLGIGLLALAAQGLLPGCARKKDVLDVAVLSPPPFTVDTALVGAAQADSLFGLVFRVPTGFQPGDKQRVAQIRELVRGSTKPGDPLATDPRWIYGIPGTPGIFKIASFLRPPPLGMNEAWLGQVREAMKAQVAPATLTEDHFRVGKQIAVARFIVRNESMVLLRVICQAPRHPPAMVDCLLAQPDYERLERALESTIGSLAPL